MTDSSAINTAALFLDAHQRNSYQALARAMIPANAALALPGADDEQPFTATLTVAQRHPTETKAALATLDQLAQQQSNDLFIDLGSVQQSSCAAAFRDRHPEQANMLAAFVLQCYYADPRVLAALNIEPRPRFPQGFEVDQGDWSILEPVKKRPKFFRPC